MNENLSGPWRLYARIVAFVILVMYATGAVGHVMPASQPLMLAMTPWFLLLMGSLVVVPSLATGGARFALWAAATYAFTFLAEAAGVATGAIFGEYEYGATLGLSWLGVPLIIAFNWVLVVNGAICLADRMVHRLNRPLHVPARILMTGLLAVLFDFIMEPVAIRLDYWRWPGNVVPLQNYVAWFVIAAVAAGFHPRQRNSAQSAGCAGNLAWFYMVVQAVFFAIRQLVWWVLDG